MNSFVFEDIGYVVKGREGAILSGISGVVNSGEVLGILGPSGAGKTSLLNVLTLNATSGKSTGICTLNGKTMTNKIFRDYCCVVPQEDKHRAFLTCRETLSYVANFYMTSSQEEKDAEVNNLLEKLGLEVCADTKVGNQFLPGLSGGQKKRLSVALALLKKPAVMLLDEPTSGLDAAASFHVMKFVKSLAKDFGIIVICTIHQPSSPIFMDFNKVMLLSQGRIAFFGSPVRSVAYFKEIGHSVPNLSNPAEFMLGEINAEFTDPEQVTAILNRWETTKDAAEMNSTITNGLLDGVSTELPKTHSDTNLSFFDEFKYVSQRQMRVIVTDPMIYMGRAFMFLMACGFFAVIYVESRDRTQEQILNRLWLTMWFCGVPTSLGVIAVYAFNEEYKAIKQETKNGMFSIEAFLLSSFVLQIPVMFMLAICAVGIPGFAIGGLDPNNFLPIVAMYTCILFTYECIARCFSVAFDNPLLGMLNFLQVWFTSFLFAGVMIPESMVIWPFRIFCYIMPLKWGISTIAWLDTYDNEYNGAWECDPSVRSDCLQHFDSNGVGETPGWSCSYVEHGAYNPLQCYGRNGDQVLDSLGMNYDVVTADDNVARNFGIIMAIAMGFQAVTVALTTIKSKLASKLEASTPDDASVHSNGSGDKVCPSPPRIEMVETGNAH